MLGSNLNSTSVALQVKGISDISGPVLTPQSTYAVVAQSNGKTLYGTTHVGNPLGWNDNFVINMKDLEYDDLMLAAFVNDDELGYANLSLMDISSTAAGNLDSEHHIRLERNGKVTGNLQVSIQRMLKQEIIGGLHPPIITLRSGDVYIEERGIEKVAASKLNFFSCMDEKEKGWEFYPYKFKSRIRPNYSLAESKKSLLRMSQEHIADSAAHI